ncbi:hypothetical protein [Ramlibacter sp. WS9]|uniref:hypothetical protein n=1 Tax=Ramlibacter sp. WS9 TaxID=1882741 RepID=UPI00130512F9|nr:hypothetical protein [Ramlibacter sp. WS9]
MYKKHEHGAQCTGSERRCPLMLYNARLDINMEQQMEVINDNYQDFGAGQVARF